MGKFAEHPNKEKLTVHRKKSAARESSQADLIEGGS